MLCITVSSSAGSALIFQVLAAFGLPAPPNSTDTGINGNLTLNFGETLAYGELLKHEAGKLNDKITTLHSMANAIIKAILTMNLPAFIQDIRN